MVEPLPTAILVAKPWCMDTDRTVQQQQS